MPSRPIEGSCSPARLLSAEGVALGARHVAQDDLLHESSFCKLARNYASPMGETLLVTVLLRGIGG